MPTPSTRSSSCGDVNSTLACTLVAAKRDVPVAHVEAGLRSFDRTMPEEVNRIVVDSISSYLFTPSADADENLLAEGADPSRIHLVGNIMVDSLLAESPRAMQSDIRTELGIADSRYGVVTLHRPGLVDDADLFRVVLRRARRDRDDQVPLVFPAHPRTQAKMADLGLAEIAPHLKIVDPRRLPRLLEARGRRVARAHRLRRRAGGDDGPRRAVPDAAREHGAAHHHDQRHERARRARSRTDQSRGGTRAHRVVAPGSPAALGRTHRGAGRGHPRGGRARSRVDPSHGRATGRVTTRSRVGCVDVSTVLIVLSCLVALPGVGTALHLGFVATASLFYRVPRGAHPADVHFLVLVPAHNEELVIANTLKAVCADRRVGDQVLVIADRCTDATASIARDAGALVLERGPDEEPGRAAARQAGVEYALGLPWDAMVMIDADSIIERGFFDACESALAGGARRAPSAERSRRGHAHPRPGDARLVRGPRRDAAARAGTGSACWFASAAPEWSCAGNSCRASLPRPASEDLWYTLDLCLEGIVPRHVENARLRSANTGTWSAAGTQRVRYEAGRMSAAKEFVKPLLRRHDAASLEAALFLITPPFAVGAACLVVGILFAALAGASLLMWVEIALFALLVAALAVALVEARARPRTWLALAIAPWYLPWKAFVQVRALLSVRRGAESFGATPRT